MDSQAILAYWIIMYKAMSNMRSDIAATIAIWYNIGPLACGRAVNEFF